MSDIIEQFLNNKSDRAEEYREIIEEMLGRHDLYGYAEQTLLSFLDYIDEHHDITDAQIQAVENIKEKPSKNAW